MKVEGKDMERRFTRLTTVLTATLAVTAMLCSTTAMAAANTPTIDQRLGISLTPSNVKPSLVCPPATPRHAQCASIRVPTPAMRMLGKLEGSAELAGAAQSTPTYEGHGMNGGWAPSELRSAYNQPESGGSSETVAIVDAYDDPNAESDLQTYREHYKVYYKGTETACTTANGCFRKVNQKGEAANYPEAEGGWAIEMSLDLDMVSAICPQCKILLVEANSDYNESLDAAVNEAATLKATEISNSWSGGEEAGETESDKDFDHPGIPITAAAGDDGYGVGYPAASPYVISVGGTSLKKDAGTRGWAEEVWAGSGGGCSAYEPRPGWQPKGPICSTHRLDNDVAAVANLETPVSFYDSYEVPRWGLA